MTQHEGEYLMDFERQEAMRRQTDEDGRLAQIVADEELAKSLAAEDIRSQQQRQSQSSARGGGVALRRSHSLNPSQQTLGTYAASASAPQTQLYAAPPGPPPPRPQQYAAPAGPPPPAPQQQQPQSAYPAAPVQPQTQVVYTTPGRGVTYVQANTPSVVVINNRAGYPYHPYSRYGYYGPGGYYYDDIIIGSALLGGLAVGVCLF